MTKDVLKVFAATYVSESEINEDEKLELIQFISEASKDEILSLLSNGSMNPFLIEIIDPRQLVETELYIEGLVEEVQYPLVPYKGTLPATIPQGKGKTGAVIAAAAAAAAVIAMGYATYKRFFSKAAKACKGSEDRKACLKKFKVNAIKAQIQTLKSGMGKCAKSNKPEKCKANVQNKINKLQAKISG
jgi:hypothetical protein